MNNGGDRDRSKKTKETPMKENNVGKWSLETKKEWLIITSNNREWRELAI